MPRRWPLTIGASCFIRHRAGYNARELRGYKYISRFTNINESLRKASEVNMLLFPEGSEAAFNMLSKNNWKTDPDCNCRTGWKQKEDDPWLIKIKELLVKQKSSGKTGRNGMKKDKWMDEGMEWNGMEWNGMNETDIAEIFYRAWQVL